MQRATKYVLCILSLVIAIGLWLKATVIQVPSGTWAPAGNMAEVRSGAASVLLQDGTILVTGGEGTTGALASAEFFNAGSFAAAPAMNVARRGHAAVVLQDGRVLVTGGKTTGGGVTNAAEIYSPALNSWIVIASMADARSGHTATLLEDGRVLLAGGEGSAAAVSTLELFYPGTGTFAVAGMMSSARMNHATALLVGARVMIAGGSNGSTTLASSEIFNAETNTLGAGPALSGPRAGFSATTLLDGKVLLAGGNNGSADLATAEIYDPAVGTISALGSSLAIARRDHLAFLLPNNSQVLIVGGTSAGVPLSSAELFRPWTSAFQPTGSLVATRSGGTGSALSLDGLLLVAGGANQVSSELYGFATVKTDKGDYAPGEYANVSGAGWQPGETVTLTFHENLDEPFHVDEIRTAVADAFGKISGVQYLLEDHDNGVRYYLAATGGTSNLQAQTTFTDATNINSATVVIDESTCTTPTSTFTQGQTVCASVNITSVGGGGGAGDFFILWVDPSAVAVQTTTKTVPATVPSGFTDTLATTVASPIGTWTVKVCKNAGCTGGNLVASAPFTLRTPTTTSVVSSLNPSIYGTGVSFTATVARSTGSGTPTGSVQFKIDGSNSGSPVLLGAPITTTSATAVSASISTLTAGTHTVEAVYIPTGTFGASTGTLSPVQTVNQKPLTISFTAGNKVYDGTTAATVATRMLTGVLPADVGNVTPGGGTATFADKNVGTGKTVTGTGFTLIGSAAANYTISPNSATTTADITPRPLTVSATGVNKVYDSLTSATVTLSDNRISGDVFTDSYTSASFADKNVGNGKTVSVSGISISGTDAGNYTFNTTASTTANITPRPLTVSATGVNKVYDGLTSATVTLSDDRVSGDVFTDNYTTASFANKNVGNGKAVSVSGISITGTDAGNYSLSNTTASTTADITPRPLTVSATGVNKVYDGLTSATVTFSDNRVSGDVLTFTYSASFADKNVGTGKAVSVSSIAISGGADQGNYALSNITASTTADITPRPLTVSATGVNKVYDSLTSATVTLSDNRISGDVFTDSYTSASFADKNVGNGKTVSVSGISISGTDAGNYTFNTTASTTANITPRPLTVSATGVNKVYDGLTSATLTLSDNRISGDVFTDNYTTASFANKNVGNGKAVSVSGISITGTDAGNYSLSNTTASTTADITPRPLTVSATGVNKVYDGLTSATVTFSDNRVSGDVLTFTYSASFADKNVGTGKAVSVSSIAISGGADQGNYALSNITASTTADITPRPLTVSATGVNKVYDSLTSATVTLSDNRISGDVFTDSYTSASFADKNVGNGKTVSVSGISISGTDAGNYTFNTTASTTANITPRPLTVSATGVNKVYDGLTSATLTLSDNRISGDVFTDSYTSAGFADKNVGSGKPVSVSGISISGTDAGNYTFNTTATAAADITLRPLTVSATGVNKVYDGLTSATVTFSDNRVSGDVLTFTYSASFADKNVGTGKAVSVSSIAISGGADQGNYALSNITASTTADITPRPLTVSATGVNKVYDSLTSATVTLSDNRISGDVFTDSYTSASFADKNVGNGKTVSVSGISISGTDAGNYTFNTTASTTANITPRPLTVSATGVNKVYDGLTSATVTLSDDRVSGDVFTDSYTSASFADKNVGSGKPVSVSGISISGTDAGNYTFNTTASATANITALAITVTAVTETKIYDGTISSTGVPTIVPALVGTDTSGFTQAFGNKNVGTGKTLTPTGSVNDGNSGLNYTVTSVKIYTGVIMPRSLTVTAIGINKVYDGTLSATVTLSDNRVSGDSLTDSYTSASFVDKNVGIAKLVNVNGISISGIDVGNYSLSNTTTSTTANITPAPTGTIISALSITYPANGVVTATVSSGVGIPEGSLSLTVDGGAAMTQLLFAGSTAFTLTSPSAGNHTLSATYLGFGNFAGSTASGTLHVNTTPTVTITGPVSGDLYKVNTPVNFTGTFTDPDASDIHTYQWTLDSITYPASFMAVSSEPTGSIPGNVSTTYSFTTPGVYQVTLTVKDNIGGSGNATTVGGLTAQVVVYDPSGGFVTGGGWIDSPAGAYISNPSLTGKANFGFVSKYLKGATKPTGETEFQFKAGNLNFHSSYYDWLVVAGAKGQYKGVGEINGLAAPAGVAGATNYKFMLTATDGQLSGGGGYDKLRMKIWYEVGATTYPVYDNLLGASDDFDASPTQALGGGSIVVHK